MFGCERLERNSMKDYRAGSEVTVFVVYNVDENNNSRWGFSMWKSAMFIFNKTVSGSFPFRAIYPTVKVMNYTNTDSQIKP